MNIPMVEKMIVMFEAEVAVIKNNHRRKWDKVESPEESDLVVTTTKALARPSPLPRHSNNRGSN